MKHPEIDEESVVEHYVAGKLSPGQVAQFEEHYLDCAECIRAVEDAERLHRGLTRVAAEDVAARQVAWVTAWHALRGRSGMALAAGLLTIALLPAGLLWQRAGRLGLDLDTARRALADERRPRVNTPILALVPTRAGAQPLQQISLRTEPEWIVLTVELGTEARPHYEATLIMNDDAMVWESAGLEPSYGGTLSVSLHSSLLPPGNYLLRLTSEGQELEFPLRVVLL